MVGYFKKIASYFLGLLNVGLFVDDGISPLISQMERHQMRQRAEELVSIYQRILVTESLKVLGMVITVLIMILINAERILDGYYFAKKRLAKLKGIATLKRYYRIFKILSHKHFFKHFFKFFKH